MKILKSYKKIAKSMLIEHAWDRKFGEPLPTIEDVMNEAEMSLKSKDSGKTVVFKNKDNYEKAKKSGDYEEPEETGDSGEEEPSGKLGGGDFERDFPKDPDDIDDLPDDGEPEDKPGESDKKSNRTGRELETITINGKQYRPIKDSVEPKKHLLRETYERIGGK